MRIYSLIVLALVACGLCTRQVTAQSTNASAVLTATLNLTAYIQQPANGPLPAVGIQKFATKDIIAAIESDLGIATNDLATAKLLLKFTGVGNTNAQVPLDVILRTSGGDTNISNVQTSPTNSMSVFNLQSAACLNLAI